MAKKKKLQRKVKNANKHYTDDEHIFIQSNWGYMSVYAISKKLNRRPGAIVRYAENYGLGGCYAGGCYLSTYEVAEMFNVNASTVRNYWIKKYNLKSNSTPLLKRPIHRILLDDLIQWCKNNQNKWSSVNLELYALGEEPRWLKLKRKKDNASTIRKKKWTKKEDDYLLMMFYNNFTIKEIAAKLERTEPSVAQRKRRILEAKKKSLLK